MKNFFVLTRIMNIGFIFITIICFLSCEHYDSSVENINPRGYRMGSRVSSDTNNLPRLEITVTDSIARELIQRRPKNYQRGTNNLVPCNGTIYVYVGGMDFQGALNHTEQQFRDFNPCTIIWVMGPDITVTATKTPVSSTETLWTVAVVNPGSTVSYIFGAGSSGAPTVGGTTEFGSPTELSILAGLDAAQEASYLHNYNLALNQHGTLTNSCPDTDGDGQPNINNPNGNANAFLHAYWTALNARSLGFELGMRLVAAHELFGANQMLQAGMDLSNDDLGLTVAQQASPSDSDDVIRDRVLNRILTGHGKKIEGTNLVRTTFDICN